MAWVTTAEQKRAQDAVTAAVQPRIELAKNGALGSLPRGEDGDSLDVDYGSFTGNCQEAILAQ